METKKRHNSPTRLLWELGKMMDHNVWHSVGIQEMVSNSKWLTKPPKSGFLSHLYFTERSLVYRNCTVTCLLESKFNEDDNCAWHCNVPAPGTQQCSIHIFEWMNKCMNDWIPPSPVNFKIPSVHSPTLPIYPGMRGFSGHGTRDSQCWNLDSFGQTALSDKCLIKATKRQRRVIQLTNFQDWKGLKSRLNSDRMTPPPHDLSPTPSTALPLWLRPLLGKSP